MQISVNPKYHALLAGRKREVLNAIMHQTETNFYFPLPFTVLNPVKQQQVAGNNSTVGEVDTYQNTIYITGEADNIQEASKRYLALVKNLVCTFSPSLLVGAFILIITFPSFLGTSNHHQAYPMPPSQARLALHLSQREN